MHYHVKIDHKSRQSHGIHVKNLSREILKERVLIPYRQGSPITLKGTTVKPNDIGRVTIFETRDAIQEHPSLEALLLLEGFTYCRDEKDLTDELITGPPGGKPGADTPSRGTEAINLSQLFDQLVTNEKLREVSRKRFLDKHYSDAVEVAFKCLNNAVKDKSGLDERDGADLMRAAFSANAPVLKLSDSDSPSARDENRGYMEIFAGSMTGVRNPRAHDHELADESDVALELLVLANHLMRKLEAATKRKTPITET